MTEHDAGRPGSAEGEVGSDAEVGGDDLMARRPLPTVRAVLAWVVLTGALGALDGWIGAGVGVVVAAVVLAGLPRRLLGGLGVLALAAVPIVVLADGLPRDAEVGPAFVSRSMWPHHLTFAGLVLISVWVVLDARHQLAARHAEPDPEAAPEPPPGPTAPTTAPRGSDDEAPPFAGLGARARLAIVALVTAGAVAASVAVLLP